MCLDGVETVTRHDTLHHRIAESRVSPVGPHLISWDESKVDPETKPFPDLFCVDIDPTLHMSRRILTGALAGIEVGLVDHQLDHLIVEELVEYLPRRRVCVQVVNQYPRAACEIKINWYQTLVTTSNNDRSTITCIQLDKLLHTITYILYNDIKFTYL